jgi:putative ABC transport system permease protein
MIKNYLKIALRNLFKQKGYSFINITGLSLGMAVCIFMFLWVKDEINYDRFHSKAGILYRLEQDQKSQEGSFHVNVTPFPVGPALKEQIPEITNTSRYWNMGTMLVKNGENAFFETGIRVVDPSFLQMFSFPLIKGNPDNVLKETHSIILSESMAEKYFGKEDPIGRTLDLNNKYLFKVTGIIKEVPDNSSLKFDMLMPFEFVKEIGRYRDSWASNSIVTYVEMPDRKNLYSVNEKITNLIYEHSKTYSKDYKPDFMLNPLTGIRLYGRFGFGQQSGAIQNVYIFSAIGIFILLIACINFMNLSTARSANRAKEVGLRKVVGANKKNIITQFYGESILITIISAFFSIIFVLCLLHLFNELSGKKISFSSLLGWDFITGILAITLLTGIFSGSYPALFISSFKPIKVLKGNMRNSAKTGFFRKILVVIQFCLSIILIIGTTIMFDQVKFMQGKNPGYDKEQLIYIPLRGETRNSYDMLKKELIKDSRVVSVSGSQQLPILIGSNSWGADWDGKDPNRNVLIGINAVDYDFVETMKIEMAEGRPFSKDFATDTSTAFMVNEEVAKLMGSNSVAGKRFDFNDRRGNIIGVMKNFHYQSIQFNIEPLAMVVDPLRVNYVLVRLPANNVQNSLDYVKSTWSRIFPLFPFDYKFFNDDFEQMFRGDLKMGKVLRIATILAILIACLGLFGLASFMAEQKTKEIGIRKVLGSSISAITVMFSKEFIKWVIAANVIAWPLAYYLMNKWLEDYAYKTPIGWWIFALAGILSISIAIITVSYQSIKAASANPIKSLRYE